MSSKIVSYEQTLLERNFGAWTINSFALNLLQQRLVAQKEGIHDQNKLLRWQAKANTDLFRTNRKNSQRLLAVNQFC